MIGFEPLGKTRIAKNYKDETWLFEVMDYVLYVGGHTYQHKEHLKYFGFKWDSDRREWWKSFDNVEELENAYFCWNEVYDGTHARVFSVYRQVKQIF